MFCALVFCGSLLAVVTAVGDNAAMDDSTDGIVIEDPNEPYVPFTDIGPGDIAIDHILDLILPGGVQRKKRTTAITNRRWKDGIIPFEIDTDYFTPHQILIILGSMIAWQETTCLTFRPATTSDENILRFVEGVEGACSSYVGMKGGVQTIRLVPGCFNVPGTIAHEIGHALGLHHEQKRPDRDEYVRVLPENVKDGRLFNFDKLTANQVLETNSPYDFKSIMHYGPKTFSKNGENTLETVDPKYQNIIGQRYVISLLDVQTVRKMYNCKTPLSLSG